MVLPVLQAFCSKSVPCLQCSAGGKKQQFAWDGNKVIAVNQDLLAEGYTAAGDQLSCQHSDSAFSTRAAAQLTVK